MWPTIPDEKGTGRNPHAQAQALLKVKPTAAQHQANPARYELYRRDWNLAWYRTMNMLPNRDRDAYTQLLHYDPNQMLNKVAMSGLTGLLLAAALYVACGYLMTDLPAEYRLMAALLVGLARCLATYQSEVAVFIEQGRVVNAQISLSGIQWKERRI